MPGEITPKEPKLEVVKEVKKTVAKKPATPKINYKQLHEDAMRLNKELEKRNEVNEHELIHIAKQRDEVTKAYREIASTKHTAEFIVKQSITFNKTMSNILDGLRELTDINIANTAIIAITENVIKEGDL